MSDRPSRNNRDGKTEIFELEIIDNQLILNLKRPCYSASDAVGHDKVSVFDNLGGEQAKKSM